jgi:hypothetical protein
MVPALQVPCPVQTVSGRARDLSADVAPDLTVACPCAMRVILDEAVGRGWAAKLCSNLDLDRGYGVD